MSTNLLNNRDIQFQLYEDLNSTLLIEREWFSDHSQETFDALTLYSTRRYINF